MYFKTYRQVEEYLGAKQDRPAPQGSPRATRIVRRENGIAVRYQATDVVTYQPDKIVLNSGGWHTSTTKARINEYAPVYVGANRGVWSVKPINDVSQIFSDGLAVSWSGQWIDKPDLEAGEKETKRIADLTKKINKYAELVKQAVIEDKIDRPSAGDCWYCLMREVESNQPLGEKIPDTDHLLSHMAEKYIVSSLVYRAVETRGSIAMRDLLYNRRESAFERSRDMLASEIKRSVVAYLKTQFGIGR